MEKKDEGFILGFLEVIPFFHIFALPECAYDSPLLNSLCKSQFSSVWVCSLSLKCKIRTTTFLLHVVYTCGPQVGFACIGSCGFLCWLTCVFVSAANTEPFLVFLTFKVCQLFFFLQFLHSYFNSHSCVALAGRLTGIFSRSFCLCFFVDHFALLLNEVNHIFAVV